MDDRIGKMIDVVKAVQLGNFQGEVQVNPPDDIGYLGMALQRLVASLEQRDQELNHLKLQIEHQNQELRRLHDVKNSFLGMAVHDLRNPLANIQLTSDVLLSDGGQPLNQEELRGFIKDISHQSRYMAELMNDILCVVEIETGLLKLAPVEVEVSGLLHDAARRHNKLAEAKGTRVVVEGEPRGKIRGDPQRLRQVLDYLVSHAVKYSPLDSLVRVSARPAGSGWRIQVQDQGPGVLEKDRPRLFQDFARLSANPTGGEKSTGLELAISRRVVEAHSGQIGADSQPGQGTIFWFEIP